MSKIYHTIFNLKHLLGYQTKLKKPIYTRDPAQLQLPYLILFTRKIVKNVNKLVKFQKLQISTYYQIHDTHLMDL